MRAVVLCLLLGLGCAVAEARQPDPAEPASPATQPPAVAAQVPATPVDCKDTIATDRPRSEDELRSLQLCQQIAKLEQEVTVLKEARGLSLASVLGFLIPVASIIGAAAGVFATLIGVRLQRSLHSSNQRKSRLDQQRLDQERHLKREEHNIRLMEGMGSDTTTVQLASAASVLQRADLVRASEEPEEQREFSVLAQVLVAILRARGLQSGVSKFVAEELVNVFKLRDRTSPEGLHPAADLKGYGLANAELVDIDWQRVYAPGVDFFKANLSKSTLRNAILRDAIFYETDLTEVVLKGADLRGANFYGAKGLDTAKFDANTTWDDTTVWPTGFTPPARA